MAPVLVLKNTTDLATIWYKTVESLKIHNARVVEHHQITATSMTRELLVKLLATMFVSEGVLFGWGKPPSEVRRVWLSGFDCHISDTMVGAEFAAMMRASTDEGACLLFSDDCSSHQITYYY